MTVHLCPVFEVSPALEVLWLAELPVARSRQIAGWASAAARHRSLIATRLLLAALADQGRGEAAMTTLHYAANGRPRLDLPLDFSLSHGGDWVACAVSTAGPVGVDVESVEPGVDASGFQLYLNERERAWAGCDARRFAAVWTLKEAVAKAAGSEGLAALPRIDARDASMRMRFDGCEWGAAPLPLDAAHAGHVAWRLPGDDRNADGKAGRRCPLSEPRCVLLDRSTLIGTPDAGRAAPVEPAAARSSPWPGRPGPALAGYRARWQSRICS